MKNIFLSTIMIIALLFAACSVEENEISKQPVTGTFTLTVNASKGEDEVTRALSLDGSTLKATWKTGDAVTVYNVTRSAALSGSLTAQSDGKSTTLLGSLTGTIAAGDNLKLTFLSPSYSSQDGTLAGIASSCDYAEATVTVSAVSTSSINTSDATFTNQQAIVEFTLKDKATSAAINVTSMTIYAGTNTINVTPALATDVIYVAIPSISSQTVSLLATSGSTGYIYEKADVSLTNGKYYGYTVSMDENPLAQALTFEAKEAGTTITFSKGTFVTNQIEFSIDAGSTWATYSSSITLANIGDKVSFRGNNPVYGTSIGSECSDFNCSKDCYVYGNVMSLINPTSFSTATTLTEPYTFANLFHYAHICNHPTKKLMLPATTLTRSCYESMFRGCVVLTEAPELPATTLAEYCYSHMFYGCWNFANPPELPATILADYCYHYMFYSCGMIDTAPELPATTLTNRCYSAMFADCRKLATPPVLPATTLAEACYSGMFKDCYSLTTAPDLPATTLTEGCYTSMFSGCSKLTTAPALPATTLADYCYTGMFQSCYKLTAAPDLPATTLADRCYWRMFQNCTGLTLSPELPATTLADYCYSQMFEGCTGLTKAPDLLAANLTSDCYSQMFMGCTKLESIKCLATDISASNCTSSWLSGVSATGTFTKAAGVNWSGKTSVSGIPSGWAVLEE